MNRFAKEDPKKRGRKKPWIRHERTHSLSAVHMDRYYDKRYGLWVCAVLDEAYHKYMHICPIQSVIVDHGLRFYANKRDKKGHANHRFERYCKRE